MEGRKEGRKEGRRNKNGKMISLDSARPSKQTTGERARLSRVPVATRKLPARRPASRDHQGLLPLCFLLGLCATSMCATSWKPIKGGKLQQQQHSSKQRRRASSSTQLLLPYVLPPLIGQQRVVNSLILAVSAGLSGAHVRVTRYGAGDPE